MKATDLMIGDWIKPYGAYDGVYMRITKINDDRVHGITTGGNPHQASFDKIYPIPLTPEILEKNGFGKQQFGHFIYENDDENLRIAFYPKNINYTNGCYDYIDIEKGCVNITEMPIEFVHQLQHALRLCGIEKEIKL